MSSDALPHGFGRLFTRLKGTHGFDRAVVAVRDGEVAWCAFNDQLLERAPFDPWPFLYEDLHLDLLARAPAQ